MARSRNIKPGFFLNEDLSRLDAHTRLLFIGLWTYADKSGRFEIRLEKIKAAIFPYEQVMLESCMTQLWDKHFLTFFEAGGKHFGQVENWNRHQSPHHKEVESEIPECESEKVFESPEDMHSWLKHESCMNQSRFKQIASSPLIPDSLNLIPDSLKFSSEIPDDEAPPSDHKYTDDDMLFAKGMYKMILKSAPKTKKPNFDKWADCIRLMRERDELTHSEIAAVFRFASQDDFWKSIILSPSNLREKFAQLDAKMRSTPNEKRNGNTADRFQIDHEDTSWYAGEGSSDSNTGEPDIQGITDDLHGLETSH